MKTNKNLKYYLSRPYKIEIYFEHEDNTWVAVHPELGRGTCYAIAETQEEALKLLAEAKKDILEIAISEGKEIPEPIFEKEELPSGQFVLRIPRSLHAQLKSQADKEQVSLNQYVLTILSEYNGAKKIELAYASLLNKLIKSFFSGSNPWYNSNIEIPSIVKKSFAIEFDSNINEINNVKEIEVKDPTGWRNFSKSI